MESPFWVPLGLYSHFIAVVLGLIVGSFLNVIVVRMPQDQSIAWPGSQCPKCKARIRWWDNIPILSYLLLRGKCRNCHTGISVRYPVIEFLTALLFLAAEMRWGLSLGLILRDWPWIAILIAVTFIDLEHQIIPDQLSIGGLIWGLLTAGLSTEYPLLEAYGISIFGAALGFCFFYGLAWIYLRMTGRSGLGGGDIKLLAMIGAFTGPKGVLTTVLISSVFGSITGLGWALSTRKKNVMRVVLPYGPFLVVGALYYYLLSDLFETILIR